MTSTQSGTLQRVTRENAMKFLIGPGMEPVLTVDPGERFVLETEDALAGKIRSEDQLPIPEQVPELAITPAELNPVAGPIQVRGAKRGDALAVTIEAIDVDPPSGASRGRAVAARGRGPRPSCNRRRRTSSLCIDCYKRWFSRRRPAMTCRSQCRRHSPTFPAPLPEPRRP